jgi:hypothetical protein
LEDVYREPVRRCDGARLHGACQPTWVSCGDRIAYGRKDNVPLAITL